MQLIASEEALRQQLAASRHERIALVPTMGCLHEGHLSLIRKAKRLADVVVVSIYVNPLQFGPNEDLERYPRPFEADVALCRAEGVDVLFHPENLYAAGLPAVTLQVKELSDCLCGRSRPGHFDGVATVVSILFHIVQPDLAVFGEKDWQQLSIIRRMVSDLHMPVEIVPAPIIREADGLAMSSRNRYLSTTERRQASGLYAALRAIRRAFEAGTDDSVALVQEGASVLRQYGLVAEYLEIRHAHSLQRPDRVTADCRAFVAVRTGSARLIDNLALTE